MDHYFSRINILMGNSANDNLKAIQELLDKCYCIAGDSKEDRKRVHDLANKVQQEIFLQLGE